MPGSAQDWPKVAIVILNWNGWQDTLECLESIEQATYPNYEVILVDNGSVDDSVTRITEWVAERSAHWGAAVELPEPVAAGLPSGARVVLQTARLTLIRSEENLGFAGGCNLAVDYALTRDPSLEFVFFLNNDARVDQECLTRLVVAAESDRADIAGAVVFSEDGRTVVSAGSRFPLELFVGAQLRKCHSSVGPWPVDRVEGAAMLVRRNLLERREAQLGYVFDPDLFVYGEELELCVWAGHQGYRVVMVGGATVRHRVTASSGGRGNSLAYYYLTRNRVLLAKRLLPTWVRLLFHVWYIPSCLVRAGQRVVQGKPEVARAILEGLVDGYSGVKGKWTQHPGRTTVGKAASEGTAKPAGRTEIG